MEPRINLSSMTSRPPISTYTLVIDSYNDFKDSVLNNGQLVNGFSNFVEEMASRYVLPSHGMVDIVEHDPFFVLLQILQEGQLFNRLKSPLLRRIIIVHLQNETPHLNV
jgi:hypothetical protein